MTRKHQLKKTLFPLLGGALLLCFSNALYADPLITGAAETGTNLHAEVARYTGQTFNHVVEGDNFTVPTLDEDVPFFTTRNHEYNGINATFSIANLGLVGAEYVMAANENRDRADYRLDITVADAVDAFVFMDTRVPQPAWLAANGWTFLGYVMGIDEGGDGTGPGADIENTFWIWQQSNIPAGTFSTYERGSSGNNMYGVAVTAPGGGPGIREFADTDFTPANFGLIDLGATGGRPEPNALADVSGNQQIGGAAHNANDVNLDAREMISPLDPDNFTIAIDNIDETGTAVGRGMDWRDRGDSVLADFMDLPLTRLGEDFMKNNAGVIRVTLGGLPAGVYDITSFHIDPSYSQCELINILVDNGDGNGFVDTGMDGTAAFADGDNGAPGLGNLTPEIILEHGATFRVSADGVHDVMILFDGRAAMDTELPLSGLNIELIPEPSSLVLVGIALIGLYFHTRRQ